MRAVNRLRHNDDFRLTTRKGVRAARSHVVVHLAILHPSMDAASGSTGVVRRMHEEPRVGFVVSKKVGNSVVRSRTKRRLRALSASLIPDLPAYSTMVVRTMPGINDLAHDALAEELTSAVAQCRRALEKKGWL